MTDEADADDKGTSQDETAPESGRDFEALERLSVLPLADAAKELIGSPVAAGLITGAVVSWELMRGRTRRKQELRALETLIHAAVESKLDPVDLVERITSKDAGIELIVNCVSAASKTRNEHKRKVLGNLLATGAIDNESAKLDEAVYLSGIIGELEIPHLRMLQHLEVNHKHPGHIKIELPGNLMNLVDPPVLGWSIIATLNQHGLVREIGSEEWSRMRDAIMEQIVPLPPKSGPPAYAISPLGRHCLEYYRAHAGRGAI